jgi:hypothetical protein
MRKCGDTNWGKFFTHTPGITFFKFLLRVILEIAYRFPTGDESKTALGVVGQLRK